MKKCRVCGGDFFKKPLMVLENMPKSAQFLPDKDSLNSDFGIDLNILQCSKCGLVQIGNEPVHYYREVIRASGISNEMTAFRTQQFTDFIKKYSLQSKKILEVGCGQGEYLSVVDKLGVNAFGIEYSDELVNKCVQSGLKAFKGYVDSENYQITNAPFDAFYIFSFLEHMPDPNSALIGIANNLADEAVGIIEVPNFDMILQKNLFSEFITDHLFYFTKDTLRSTLSLNGFEVIECNDIWHDYIISATVKKRKSLDISHFSDCKNKIITDIDSFLASFAPKSVAIWGAGHQSLAVIALTQIADKIKYVFDSAPFKQGKYTPSTHIPIVAPDMLNTAPVDAVIIIAGSYSDEVESIIRQKYNNNTKVAILRDYGLEIV